MKKSGLTRKYQSSPTRTVMQTTATTRVRIRVIRGAALLTTDFRSCNHQRASRSDRAIAVIPINDQTLFRTASPTASFVWPNHDAGQRSYSVVGTIATTL